MARIHALLTYQMRTTAPLALGPADERAGREGQLVLAGATIKGAVRHLVAQLAASLGEAVCRADGDPSCAVCRLFGAPGLEAALRWGDAPLAQGGSDASGEIPVAGVRLRQPVLRNRRVAAPLVVPARRVTAAGPTFAGRAEGWLGEQADGGARRDLAFVAAALRLLSQVGGARGLGCGRVTIEVNTIELNGQRYASADLVDALFAGGQG